MRKYEPLGRYLSGLDKRCETLSFVRIEEIIRSSLPSSAKKYREWWANDRTSHYQSFDGWLSVGWRVKSIDMDREKVVFKKTLKRNVSCVRAPEKNVITVR